MNRLTGKRSRETGGAAIALLLTIAIVVGGGFAGLSMLLIMIGGFSASGTAAESTASTAPIQTGPDGAVEAVQINQSVDLGQGGLVCIYLSGVRGTPALDRRVAPKLYDVLTEVKERRLQRLDFTWLFRTNCQQWNIKGSYGVKAKPGTSPHEAGRAVDVSGMTSRIDRYQIVEIFRKYGWKWLGTGHRPDPPHFEIEPWQVGEPNKGEMIRRAQEDWKRGNIAGGCKGSECGS